MKKVSFVITARNAEQTIVQTLRSVLRQLKRDDEILLLLDACEDKTGELASSFMDRRVKIFESKERLGRSRGRNYLIANSDSDLISICDADDIALPWRLNLARKLMVNYDAIFGTAIVFGRDLKPFPLIPQVPRTIPSEQMPIELLGRNPLVHSTATFRRSLLDTVGCYRDSEAEEYDLWLRMANAGFKLYRTATPVAMYRVHKMQASRSPGFVERGLECRYVIQEQIKLATMLGLSQKTIAGIRGEALSKTKKSGLLARLEVAGLPTFLTGKKHGV